MREERLSAGLVEADQELPELALVLGKIPAPVLMALVDLLRPHRFPETLGLAEARALEAEFETGVGGEAIEHLQDEGMKRRCERQRRIGGKRIAKRQRPLRGEVEHQPVRQWPDRLVFLFLSSAVACRPAVSDDARGRLAVGIVDAALFIGLAILGIRYRLVLGPDEATLDAQFSVGPERDEDTGAGDFIGFVDDGSVVQRIELGAELLEPVFHLPVVVLGFGIFGIELVVFGLDGVMPGKLVRAWLPRLAIDATHAGGVAVWKVDCRVDPLPAFLLQGFGVDLEFFEDKLLEQGRILVPAAAILIEQIAQDDAAGLLVRVGADIDRATDHPPAPPSR